MEEGENLQNAKMEEKQKSKKSLKMEEEVLERS